MIRFFPVVLRKWLVPNPLGKFKENKRTAEASEHLRTVNLRRQLVGVFIVKGCPELKRPGAERKHESLNKHRKFLT